MDLPFVPQYCIARGLADVPEPQDRLAIGPRFGGVVYFDSDSTIISMILSLVTGGRDSWPT